MSIAVSALVRPSRVQRLVSLAAGLAQCAAALTVGLHAPERFACATAVAFALAGAGLALLGAAIVRPKTHRIDISGTGALRVTVQQDVGGRDGGDSGPGDAVLLPGSVIWPVWMGLRYAAPGMTPRVLQVWRDGVDAAAWRALAVALAVVGRRGDANEGCEDSTNSMQRTNS